MTQRDVTPIAPVSRPMPSLGGWIAGGAVLLAASALLLGNDTDAQSLLRLLVFEGAFVLLPGWALYRVLWREDTRISRQLTYSFALGYAAQLAAYSGAAAAGMRALWLLLPVIALIVIAVAGRRGMAEPGSATVPPPPTAIIAALAGIISISFGYLWCVYFLDNPLPGTVDVVSYYVDAVHDMSLITKAMRDWPIGDPHVHGEPFAYYTLPFTHLAALAEFTGGNAPLAFFRMYLVPVLAVLGVQTYYLGTVAGNGSRIAGLVAAASALLVGELDLSLASIYPFYNTVFFSLIYSPSFSLGAILFLPIVAEVTVRRERWHAGHVIGLTVLLVCAAGTKAHIVPLVLCGSIGAVAWTAMRDRKLDWYAVVPIAACSALFAAVYLVGQDRTTSVAYSPLLRAPRVTTLPMPVPVVIGLAAMLGVRMIGLLASMPAIWRSPSSPTTRMLGISVVGIGATALLDMGSAEYYFLWLVYFLLSALTGGAVVALWQRRTSFSRALCVAAAVLFTIGLADLPIDYADRMGRITAGRPVHQTAGKHLTSVLWSGLAWARDHLPANAVVAVNNHLLAPGDARNFYYSAFAERDAFLEGWMYSDRAHAVGYTRAALGEVHPFPEKYALNSAVFATGSDEAIASIRLQGATHLLVDKVHGPATVFSGSATTLLFENSDVAIYEIK